jgi:translation elongation factor P/translation initiation factor 5A
LNHFNSSIVLYDGNLYKVLDRKNSGFKVSKRYFQIKKNCFKYYKDIESAKNDKLNQPLVQFDIRHIKDLQIVDQNFLKDIKIEGKDIEFVFSIYLYQNDDFFVFATDNENYGNSIFNLLNLLKNYYKDKK